MKSTGVYIIGISGSLRSQSSNTILLHAISALLPEEAYLEIYDKLDQLPHFNPDLDGEKELKAVKEFREKLKIADAVVISTPEYAFGVPGVLKNALDWVVSSGEMNEKPVAAVSASPLTSGGDKALSSLLLTLTALGTDLRGHSSYSIPAVYKKLNAEGEITDTETASKLASLTKELCKKVKAHRAS
ncbi:MAG: NAD(P)H-dependent oxidoreductase [Williamsia sp.]|nr:NAD(P)H-dependent oxidoreductase [Williamsia sp.]